MRKIIMVVMGMMVAMLMLIGCAGTARYSPHLDPARAKNFTTVKKPAGAVPVHIENPDLLSQEVCLFEGNTSVAVIPDSRRGGWMYSRPAFACYRIGGANSENNWYEYAKIMLPRNTSFVLAARINGIMGQGRPYFRSFRTGGDPFAVTYSSVTPFQRYVSCGALVRLYQQPSSVQPMNVKVDIDFRPLGAAITGGLIKAAYGR